MRDVFYCVRNKLLLAYDKFSNVPDVTPSSSAADWLVLFPFHDTPNSFLLHLFYFIFIYERCNVCTDVFRVLFHIHMWKLQKGMSVVFVTSFCYLKSYLVSTCLCISVRFDNLRCISFLPSSSASIILVAMTLVDICMMLLAIAFLNVSGFWIAIDPTSKCAQIQKEDTMFCGIGHTNLVVVNA